MVSFSASDSAGAPTFLILIIVLLTLTPSNCDANPAVLNTTVKPVLPTPYPSSFRIQFDTNITRQQYLLFINQQQHPLRSTLYYEWSLQSQRIDHPAGAYECVRFYNVTNQGCKLYFLPAGMYRVVEHHDVPCCLDIPDLGAPPPDWARQARPTFRGLVHDAYSGYDAYEFVFDSDSKPLPTPSRDSSLVGTVNLTVPDIHDQYHTAREVHENGLPLTFTFPSKAFGRQDFHFDPASLVVGRQDQSLFQLPQGCKSLRCQESTINLFSNA